MQFQIIDGVDAGRLTKSTKNHFSLVIIDDIEIVAEPTIQQKHKQSSRQISCKIIKWFFK